MIFPDHVERGRKRELYMSYFKGWCDGGGMRSLRPEFINHQTRPDLKKAYERGWTAGRKALTTQTRREAKRIGYEPTILRTSAPPPTPMKEPTP